MVACNFYLEDNEKAVYYAGQMVKGYVELVLDEPKSMRNVKIIVQGNALAYCDQSKQNCFLGKEKYLNSETIVFGSSDGPTVELPAGTHRYNFECLLPEEIPASFDFKHEYRQTKGHIRYSIELKIDMKWKLDKEFKKDFEVLRREDLNLNSELALACSVEESKQFCCLFCASQPLTMQVSIPQTGYVGGQIIPIKVKYSNKSNIDIDATFAELRQIFMMFSSPDQSHINFEKKITNEEIAREMADGVGKMSEAEVEINLKLPEDLEPSRDRHCKVLKKFYELQVTASGPCCRKDLIAVFPITIGKIPILSQQTQILGPITPPHVMDGRVQPEELTQDDVVINI